MINDNVKPVIIIGAGISGLLLAQYLHKSGISFLIFERDTDLTTRGAGWGLTLHWSLPALRTLLPDELVRRLPESYVDRVAVEEEQASTFPMFDLSTGELKALTPKTPESQRIRVSRERLRLLLSSGIDIQWGKTFKSYSLGDESLTVLFEDGSSYVGSLLAACDGGHSRIRRALFPDRYQNYQIPVRVLGVKVNCTAKEIEPMRALDPFFFQAASSEDDTFVYFSVLDAPGNNNQSTDKYSCQLVVSWPSESYQVRSTGIPHTDEAMLELLKTNAATWAEPFRSFTMSIPRGTEVKQVPLSDWPPPKGLRGKGPVVLVGDAFHPMAMYRGEGANHAIVDVLDFAQIVASHLSAAGAESLAVSGEQNLRVALDMYEDGVIARVRPAVLASRRASIDAHKWSRINEKSPLLSKRAMRLEFEEA